MAKARLFYLPLGGAGEIGMNMYVYGYGPTGRENLIIVDAGISFPDSNSAPGIDLVIPDISWLRSHKKRIKGIFLTHAHEDHLGALARVLENIDAPVFGRRFTTLIASNKLAEFDIPTDFIQCVDQYPSIVDVGAFKVSFIPVTHSIPESSALLIESPAGRIVHTGDFRIDSKPLIGEPFDHNLWKQIGKGDVTALVCDSTNVFINREGRSESIIGPAFTNLFDESKGLVAATTFASNVARVRQIAEAAHNVGRSIVLLGRAMTRMTSAALEAGVISSFPPCVEPSVALGMPREKLLLLTTGSQGEDRSATTQLSYGKFRGFKLVAGDTMLFSSKTIPGNELSVAGVMNRLAALGVNVIEDHEQVYHVSGHANRPEVTKIHHLLSPDLVIPMHGEIRHLVEHARLAKLNGYNAVVVKNGQLLNLKSKKIEDHSDKIGKIYLDQDVMISEDSQSLKERRRMSREGVIFVNIIVYDEDNIYLCVECIGFEMIDNSMPDEFVKDFIIQKLEEIDCFDEKSAVSHEIEIANSLRKTVANLCGKRPILRINTVVNQR